MRLARLTLRRPAALIAFALAALGGSALVSQPLFGLPGYELSAALALGLGLFGWIPAAMAARTSTETDTHRVDHAIVAGLLLNLFALLPPLAVSIAYATASTRCSPFAMFAFFPLLPLPSALIASCVGVALGLGFKRAWALAVAGLVLLLAWAAWSAWPLVFGPQVYVFNALGGYLPGPLYDETLAVTPALLWFRLETLLGAAALWLFLRARYGGARYWPLFAAAALMLELLGPKLGTRMTDEVLEQKLGGKKESAHFVLHYPRGKGGDELERMVRDLELRHAQISNFLGGPPPGKVTVWWYRSAEEKQALVGAGGTQFAKPWRREVHVNDSPFPHRVVKHELVHAMAAPFGAGPFGVTSNLFGLNPNPAVIEGLAEAGDNPIDELTLHEWAAGMREEKMLPSLTSLFGLGGFYQVSANRAYVAAGSFMRWLGDTHGGEKLREVYRDGNFQRVYGRGLDQLEQEWLAFLNSVPLEPRAKAEAFARFRRGSIFQRPCAREVASLTQQAAELSGGDPLGAAAIYARCAQLQPDEPGHVLAQAQRLQFAGELPKARELLQNLALRDDVKSPALAAEVAMTLADVTHAMHDDAAAREQLNKVLGSDPSAAMDRTARVKLHGLTEEGAAVWAYFSHASDEAKGVALTDSGKDPYVGYLLGRRMAQTGAPRLCVEWMNRALENAPAEQPLPESIVRELWRLKVENEYLLGDCAAVQSDVSAMPAGSNAYQQALREWGERCEFEDATFNGPLVPKEALR
ncbi:MAG: hypothetical protein QM723_33570 [Myxococcaceae bacterium]